MKCHAKAAQLLEVWRVQPLPLEPNCKVARHLYTCSTSGTCSSCESSSVTTGSDVVEPRGAVVKRPIFESESQMPERALTGVAPRALASSTSDTCETGGARSVASGGGRCGKGAAGGAHLMVQAREAGNGEGVVEPGVDELLRREKERGSVSAVPTRGHCPGSGFLRRGLEEAAMVNTLCVRTDGIN